MKSTGLVPVEELRPGIGLKADGGRSRLMRRPGAGASSEAGGRKIETDALEADASEERSMGEVRR